MGKKWNHVIGCVTQQTRPFNDYVIYDYRRDGIDGIPDYIDKVFTQAMKFFGGQMTYTGYRALTPEERIAYIVNNPIIKGCVNIRRTETQMLQYSFEFQGKTYYAHIPVPYLINERVICNDTEYYPQFLIVEKGGVNRTDNGTIIVKVMRAPFTYGRRPTDKLRLISQSGRVYLEQLITVKIHQGSNSGKKSEQIPLVLYHFCKLGYPQTMKLFNMDPNDVTITTTFDAKDPEYEYFLMPDGQRFMKVKTEILKDCYKLRMVLSLYRIYVEIPQFDLDNVFSDDPTYYRTVLGKFISSRDTSLNKLLLPNANKHLDMTDPMLDLVAQEQLTHVGCHVKDIYELNWWMYYHIDDLLISYDPTNMFDKKIESLDQLAARVARKVAYAQYNIINSKKATLDAKTVEQFCKRCSLRDNWISSDDNSRSSKVFRPNPSVYNDNWLISIGAKRSLSMESVTAAGSKSKKGSKSKTSPFLLKAHYSHLIVTTILDIPASNPVVTGSINPYIEILHGVGNILIPWYAKEIEKIFN